MDTSREQLLELIRCGLWTTDPDLSLFEVGVDWDRVLRLACEQTVSGIIYPVIEKLPSSLRPSRSSTLRLHQLILLNKQHRSCHVVVASRVCELLRGAGITCTVLLKGVGVGANYPDPSLRQCGDVDIFVGEEFYLLAMEFLSLEFALGDIDTSNDQHFDFEYMQTHIEIHRWVTSPKGVAYRGREFIRWSESQLTSDRVRRVVVDGAELTLPPLDFDFIYIFYHTWRHFLVGGVGFRQFCDWCRLVYTFSQEFDRDEICRLIAYFRLETPIAIFSTIAVEVLGLDPSRLPCYRPVSPRLMHKALLKVWEGGNFGFYRPERKSPSRTVLHRKWCSFRILVSNMRFMLSIDWVYALRFYRGAFSRSIRASFKQFKTLNRKLS
ncbi:MAG: nucleotidyltransferase family protein [Rikenellaceae bacterium]